MTHQSVNQLIAKPPETYGYEPDIVGISKKFRREEDYQVVDQQYPHILCDKIGHKNSQNSIQVFVGSPLYRKIHIIYWPFGDLIYENPTGTISLSVTSMSIQIIQLSRLSETKNYRINNGTNINCTRELTFTHMIQK